MAPRKRALLWGVPLLLLYAAGHIVPFAVALWYSLLSDMFARRFAGLGNYAAMLRNPYFRLAVRNTARFTVPAVATALAAAVLLAALFRELGGAGEGMRAAFILPMLLPSAAVTPVFRLLFAGKGMAALLGADRARVVPLFLLYVWKNTGMLFIILASAMRMVPRERYEAAALDGAGPWRRLWSVTLPSVSGALLFSGVYALMQAFRVFKEAYLLYGAYPGEGLYMLQHYMNNHFAKLDFPSVSAAGVAFTAFCLPPAALAIRAEERVLG